MDEKRIVRLCKSGRHEYFEQLVYHYEQPLYRYCLHLCNNRERAMDLFQDTWLKAVSRISKYDDSYPFKSWLFTITTNTFRDSYRKEKRRAAVSASFNSTEDMTKAMELAESREKPADRKLEESEMRSLVRAEVAGLKWKHRSVVILHYFEDMPVKEIGTVLGLPEGTVKSRLAYARGILKKCLEGLV